MGGGGDVSSLRSQVGEGVGFLIFDFGFWIERGDSTTDDTDFTYWGRERGEPATLRFRRRSELRRDESTR